MDSVAEPLVDLARNLIDIESTSGGEAAVTTWLARCLRERGYTVTEQPVVDDRVNVLATVGATEPETVYSTHIDCVPPFFPSRIEGDTLYGRGACDAKGILAAQIMALDRLRDAGETRVGLVVVVGEENGSHGARAANRLSNRSRYLINGEPTDNRLAAATKGAYRVRLSATGRAVHSAYPHLGDSAIEKLLDALVALRGLDLPVDPVLGPTTYTVGVLSGGVAPNVVPPVAEADVNFRTVEPAASVRELLDAAMPDTVAVDDVMVVPPVRMTTLPGFETAPFSFTTDIPFLTSWGKPLLVGPGSIHVAHTAEERVQIDELVQAVDLYENLARDLLADES
jgi:acetylornithine deacetylase